MINNKDKCLWKQDEDGAWDLSCGERYEITEGTPRENHMKFCCYCGKRIRQKSYRYGH